MHIDVVNGQNEKVGRSTARRSVRRAVKTDLIWESVVQANAAERRGTHATKNRALVSGSGKKPWRQKGTGRARVGEIAKPAVAQGRHRVRAAAAQLRVRAAEEGRSAARCARRSRRSCRTARCVVVDALAARDQDEGRRRDAEALGVSGKTLLIDVKRSTRSWRWSVRNSPRVRMRAERAACRRATSWTAAAWSCTGRRWKLEPR